MPTVRIRNDIQQRVRSVPFQSLYSFASRCQRRGWLQLLTTDELAPVPTVAGTATPVPTVAGTATPVPTVAIQAPDSADRGAAALVDLGANARVTELSTEFAKHSYVVLLTPYFCRSSKNDSYIGFDSCRTRSVHLQVKFRFCIAF